MSATVLAADLARIITDAAIFSSRDTGLPMINSVQLESSTKHLVAVGTDRFTMGSAVADWSGEGETFTAALGLPQAQLVAKVAKSTKAAFTDVMITAADTTVSFQFASGEALTLPKVAGTFDFPDWRKLMEQCRDNASGTEMMAYNPAYLTKFARVTDARRGRMSFTFRGPTKPAMVSVGLQFVGIIMPIRLGADDAGSVYPEWLNRPEPPAPPKKRAPRKRPAKKAAA